MAIIAQVLLDAGHDVEIYDINSVRHTPEQVAEYLSSKKYDMIGIGGLITTYKYLNLLVPLLREIYKTTPIVIGGAGLTSAPEVYMEHLRPDYAVIGEGEYTMLELANGVAPEKILGLAYYKDGELVFNPPRPLEKNLDNFPWQAFDLMDMEKYTLARGHNRTAQRELAVLASRGCPHNCSFCYHVFGRSMRQRSVDNVLDEMEYLIGRYGVEAFMILDELFTARKSYVLEFCEKIMERKLGVEWTCYSRVDTLNEEMMAAMRWAGCWKVGFGIESGSQRILNEMNKRVTPEQALETYRMAKKYFRRIRTTLIYGMPGEDKKSVEDTVRWCVAAGINQPLYHLSPHPGTQVYKENIDKILAKFGSEHEFFQALGDVRDFVINLTNFTDDEYFLTKYTAEKFIYWKSIKIVGYDIDKPIPNEYIRDGKIFLLHPEYVGGKRPETLERGSQYDIQRN